MISKVAEPLHKNFARYPPVFLWSSKTLGIASNVSALYPSVP